MELFTKPKKIPTTFFYIGSKQKGCKNKQSEKNEASMLALFKTEKLAIGLATVASIAKATKSITEHLVENPDSINYAFTGSLLTMGAAFGLKLMYDFSHNSRQLVGAEKWQRLGQQVLEANNQSNRNPE